MEEITVQDADKGKANASAAVRSSLLDEGRISPFSRDKSEESLNSMDKTRNLFNQDSLAELEKVNRLAALKKVTKSGKRSKQTVKLARIDRSPVTTEQPSQVTSRANITLEPRHDSGKHLKLKAWEPAPSNVE